MLTIRRFEERASADYLAGKIYGVLAIVSTHRDRAKGAGLVRTGIDAAPSRA